MNSVCLELKAWEGRWSAASWGSRETNVSVTAGPLCCWVLNNSQGPCWPIQSHLHDTMGSQGTIRGASLGQWEVMVVSQKVQPSGVCGVPDPAACQRAFRATSDLLPWRSATLIGIQFASCAGAALAPSCVLCLRGWCFVRAQFNLAALSPLCRDVCLDLKKALGLNPGFLVGVCSVWNLGKSKMLLATWQVCVKKTSRGK